MKKEASAPNQAYVKPARGSKSMQANPGTFDAVASRCFTSATRVATWRIVSWRGWS